MIDVNKNAFENLITQFVAENSEIIPEAIRYFKSNESEKEWIKKSNVVDVLYLTPFQRIIQIEYLQNEYFAVIGSYINTSSIDPAVSIEEEINGGIAALLISLNHLRLYKKSNLLEFYNNILFQHLDNNYKGHNFKDLIPYIDTNQLFKIPDYSIISDNKIGRFACYIYSNSPAELVLDFDKIFLNTISEISLVGSEIISYKIILSCLFSTSYKHAFLELYRLLERLFPINYLKDFHLKSGTKLSFLEFSAELENTISWRPKEEDAIEIIFNNTQASTKTIFTDFLDSSPNLHGQKDSKYFYSLRNSIVHFRANHVDHELSNVQWNKLLIATIHLIDEQYSLHNSILK